ncbi:MAG: anhydro-N-acetylmuramic acid kinase [Phycisphaerales bacterium]
MVDRVRFVAGCMTGTSLDALDCALVRIEGTGLTLRASLVRTVSQDLGALRGPLRALCDQQPMRAGEVAKLAREFAMLHARTLKDLARTQRLDLVCVHGQTVFHAPPLSWQLMNPWPIVEELRTPVVFDLRGADLAAGGQGAPITPLADAVLFAGREELRPAFGVINLGGFANVTSVSEEPLRDPRAPSITGFDICVCNQLLNAIARAGLDADYDRDGRAAQAGHIDFGAASELAQTLAGAREHRKSLGTGDESFAWIRAHAGRLSGPDLAATACDAIGLTIGEACRGFGHLILAGGGVHNRALFASIERHAKSRDAPSVRVSDDLGLPAAFREAVEFAVLGALCQDRVPITLPSVTNVRTPAPLSGCWAYPPPSPPTS